MCHYRCRFSHTVMELSAGLTVEDVDIDGAEMDLEDGNDYFVEMLDVSYLDIFR